MPGPWETSDVNVKDNGRSELFSDGEDSLDVSMRKLLHRKPDKTLPRAMLDRCYDGIPVPLCSVKHSPDLFLAGNCIIDMNDRISRLHIV
jgi:hypothetical protein